MCRLQNKSMPWPIQIVKSLVQRKTEINSNFYKTLWQSEPGPDAVACTGVARHIGCGTRFTQLEDCLIEKRT